MHASKQADFKRVPGSDLAASRAWAAFAFTVACLNDCPPLLCFCRRFGMVVFKDWAWRHARATSLGFTSCEHETNYAVHTHTDVRRQ